MDAHDAVAAGIVEQAVVQSVGFLGGFRKRIGLNTADKRIALIQSHG